MDWAYCRTRISQSPIWDSVVGFGGDGVPGTNTVPPDPANTSKILPDWFYHGCVKDGPFADYTVKLGPGLLVTEHCITRGVNDTFSSYLTSSVVTHILSLATFEQFRVSLEGMPVPPDVGPHGGGHAAIGGDMSNYFSSPAGKYPSSEDITVTFPIYHLFLFRPTFLHAPYQP